MKKLAIIIVNYNVAFFLEQCLNSVFVATKGVDAEVFVVDNNSVDESVDIVKQKFPQVRLISNKENVGFSKANNQAILLSNSEYILLLNPDTLVQEDTFHKVCNFMDQTTNAGGLGVKMIDGKGRFLPESKRGLPTPLVAFYKIFGLAKFFPKSKRFGQYHLGFLPKNETNPVDVLSGAFMLLRQSVLNQIGLLDEAFFMYGEDIDLSYRITQAGYQNYYFADTEIIHYKGESTKKGSLNYVFVFYRAMVIFANKHFSSRHAGWFSLIINLAIWFRASLAVINRLVKVSWLPAVDAIGMSLLWKVIAPVYEDLSDKQLDSTLVDVAFPLIGLLWVVVCFFSASYDRPLRYLKLLRSSLYAAVVLLVVYSLLPEDWRFSRLMIIFGSLGSMLYLLLTRFILQKLKVGFYGYSEKKHRHFAIVGNVAEQERLVALVKSALQSGSAFFFLTPQEIAKLNDLCRLEKIDEIIFSGKDLSAREIIGQMTEVQSSSVDFKIAPPESEFIIGSNSIDSQGDFYLLEMSGIYTSNSLRTKRLVDFLICLVILPLLPVFALWQKNAWQFVKNWFLSLLGEVSWVGFNKSYSNTLRYNKLKKGIVPVLHMQADEEQILKANLLYAKDYRWYKDVQIVLRNTRELGGKPA